MGATSDGEEIVRLSKEHAELRPVAEAVEALTKALAERPELEVMAASDDPDYLWVRETWRDKDPRVPLVTMNMEN